MGNARKRFGWGFLGLQGMAFGAAMALIVLRIRASPGELAAVHAGECELQGTDGCGQCHGEGPPAEFAFPCASCHAEIRAQVAGRTGFHGLLPADRAVNCGPCHLEHKGRDFPPVNRQSFALAGIADVSLFAHEGLHYRLTGKHEMLECRGCHPLAETKVLAKGEKRFLGLDQRCTRCHNDAHEGTFGADCETCHGQEAPFHAVAGFRHTEAFPLAGSHRGRACVACHTPGTQDAVSALLPAGRVRAEPVRVRECAACHRSPHGEDFLARIGGPFGRTGPDTCAGCHSAEHPSFLGPYATLTKRQHAASGFPLTPPHDRPSCASCHEHDGPSLTGEPAGDFRRRHPGRRPDDCRACHGDPHRGEFEIGAFKGNDCLSCHSRQAFIPPEFDVAKHDVAFRLEGRHRKVPCGQCHAKTAPEGPRDFRGVPAECRSCHEDPHGGQFDKAAYRGGDCRACHTQRAWRPSTFTLEMHEKAAFTLAGAHLGAACSRCHPAGEADRSRAAPPPPPRAFAGVASPCSACHADVHGGKFDGPGRPAAVGGRQGCARCHGTEGFRPVLAGAFDHRTWTGHALNGVHAKLGCAACHGRAAVPDSLGRTLGEAAGTACQSCHSDPHVGQFGPTRSVDCAKCHREEGAFRDLLFDHRRDSRWPLDEVHSKLACAACHKPMPVAGGTSAVRYKPLGVQCGDCHEPRGPR